MITPDLKRLRIPDASRNKNAAFKKRYDFKPQKKLAHHFKNCKTFIMIFFVFSATACAENGMISNMYNTVSMVTGSGDKSIPFTREDIRKKGNYATLMAAFPGKAFGTLVLYKVDGTRMHWISGDRKIIVTDNGKIIETAGIESNIQTTSYSDNHPIFTRQYDNLNGTFYTMNDFKDEGHFGVKITSTYERSEPFAYDILGTPYTVFRLTEHNHRTDIDWEYSNSYLVDTHTNRIIASEQQFTPATLPLDIRVLIPYAYPQN